MTKSTAAVWLRRIQTGLPGGWPRYGPRAAPTIRWHGVGHDGLSANCSSTVRSRPAAASTKAGAGNANILSPLCNRGRQAPGWLVHPGRRGSRQYMAHGRRLPCSGPALEAVEPEPESDRQHFPGWRPIPPHRAMSLPHGWSTQRGGLSAPPKARPGGGSEVTSVPRLAADADVPL